MIGRTDTKLIGWILRIAIAGEFFGHGIFGLSGKEEWIGWIIQITAAPTDLATQLLFLIGILDLLIALIVIVKPIRLALLWATLWGFWTALLRPIVGEPIWDFIERWPNWGAPLTLLLILGWPKTWRQWLS